MTGEEPATGKSFRGVINIDIKQSKPDWAPYRQPQAPDGSPNVGYVVLDDVGFAAMEPFGGPIETPTLQRIADHGLTYTNFHTTALCSPTRSCLLTGRNHTTNNPLLISWPVVLSASFDREGDAMPAQGTRSACTSVIRGRPKGRSAPSRASSGSEAAG